MGCRGMKELDGLYWAERNLLAKWAERTMRAECATVSCHANIKKNDRNYV